MKALVLVEYKKLLVQDVPMPEIADDEVLVRVRTVSICGSDVHGYDGSTGRRMPPIIMGHEAAGEIAQVGSRVQNYQPGDRVTFDSTIYCGQCAYCRQGLFNLCNNRQIMGVSIPEYRRHGAFAEYVAVPERVLYRVPDPVSYAEAAMIEPLSIGFHAINITPIKLGDSVLVIGAGTIGQMIIKLLKNSNAARIFVSDLDPVKLEAAKSSGANHVFGADADLIQGIADVLPDQDGVDVTIEAVGVKATVQNAIAATRKGGQVTLVGNVTPVVPLPLQDVITRQLTLRGSAASNGEYDRCLDMLALGKVSVDDVISQTISLEEAPEWFERLYRAEPGLMKVQIEL